MTPDGVLQASLSGENAVVIFTSSSLITLSLSTDLFLTETNSENCPFRALSINLTSLQHTLISPVSNSPCLSYEHVTVYENTLYWHEDIEVLSAQVSAEGDATELFEVPDGLIYNVRVVHPDLQPR